MLSGVALAIKGLGPDVWVVYAEPEGGDDTFRCHMPDIPPICEPED
jgi:hypothetical protein